MVLVEVKLSVLTGTEIWWMIKSRQPEARDADHFQVCFSCRHFLIFIPPPCGRPSRYSIKQSLQQRAAEYGAKYTSNQNNLLIPFPSQDTLQLTFPVCRIHPIEPLSTPGAATLPPQTTKSTNDVPLTLPTPNLTRPQIDKSQHHNPLPPQLLLPLLSIPLPD